MSDAIVVTDAVRIPPSALTVHAVRASGPGGQNVNKVATKI
ncbi:MAG: aminoacyl-tRNA hydrolase, partial [Candidatus Rokubacteria bacterium]|nr:aminoacyl-tRNA hydrolase [Candidatus Rokubacteria bacterium]